MSEKLDSIYSDSSEGGQKKTGGQKKWSETTQKVLDLIKQNPQVSRKELCDNLHKQCKSILKNSKPSTLLNAAVVPKAENGLYWMRGCR